MWNVLVMSITFFYAHNLQNTLPKANIDPESRPSQKAGSLPTNM